MVNDVVVDIVKVVVHFLTGWLPSTQVLRRPERVIPPAVGYA